MKSIYNRVIFFFLAAMCASACCEEQSAGLYISGFEAPLNIKAGQPIYLDYTDAIDSGFIIPTIRQAPEGGFVFSFKVANKSTSAAEYFYKIYYQNETYKMPEGDAEREDALNGENFYGSWESTDITFKSIPVLGPGDSCRITDTFRITGNPRNERLYYSPVPEEKYPPAHLLNEKIAAISSDSNWLRKIALKAQQGGMSFAEQLKFDASFMVNTDRLKDTVNCRWQRNPRVGNYSFMLVVCSKNDLGRIPLPMKNIGVKLAKRYASPYYYFLTGKGSRLPGTVVKKINHAITVKAKPDPGSGIYISSGYFRGQRYKRDFFHERCNEDSAMYQQAAFMQFVHAIDTNVIFNNVPAYSDFESNDFGPAEYKKATQSYSKEQMVPTHLGVTDCPCKTVRSDQDKKILTFKNSGNAPGQYRKENTGIVSRHGFTYGKFTARVKFAELLNTKKVWNGLTNAFWFINQGDDHWGLLRNCNKDGYIPKNEEGEHAPRKRALSYSEIDFEVRKTSRYWPATSYHSDEAKPVDDRKDSDMVIVTCTNWDLACRQPSNFDVGVHHINCYGQDIPLHRWNHWYKAVTSKYAAPDDELFAGEYYYFQLEWKPDEIIWRIGPSRDKLRVVGYMNNKVTSIPNNQMLMLFTQEYHPSAWWPESQYEQEYIPFLSKDLEGRIYEVEIE